MELENRKRILITGSAGFVGWNAVRRLVNRRHDIVATFRTLPHYLQYVDGLQPVALDLRDGTSIAEVVARFQPNLILHFAALARPQLDRDDASLYEVNVEGSARLARTAALHDVPILYLSTDLVYPADAGCCSELSPLDRSTENPYARSKLQGEEAIQEYASRWIIIRPSLMYGSGTPRSNCFTQFLDRHWLEGRKSPVFLDQFRSILYVQDLLRAIEIVALERPSWNNIFVCGGPERLSRAEFALRYAAARGVSLELCERMRASELVGYQGGASDIWLDSSKLQGLGWEARSLEEAVRGGGSGGDSWGEREPGMVSPVKFRHPFGVRKGESRGGRGSWGSWGSRGSRGSRSERGGECRRVSSIHEITHPLFIPPLREGARGCVSRVRKPRVANDWFDKRRDSRRGAASSRCDSC